MAGEGWRMLAKEYVDLCSGPHENTEVWRKVRRIENGISLILSEERRFPFVSSRLQSHRSRGGLLLKDSCVHPKL